jgi:hypothetical protein
LIPNSLWSNPVFRSISLLSFLAWVTVTANQYFIALFFEKVQLLSVFATSLRFLPLVVSGVLANVATACWSAASAPISDRRHRPTVRCHAAFDGAGRLGAAVLEHGVSDGAA